MKKVYFFAITILLIGCSQPKEDEDMKTVLNEMIEKQETPSVQYMIAKEDSVLFEFFKGYSNLENNELTDASSRYNIFSVTKNQFTSLIPQRLHRFFSRHFKSSPAYGNHYSN